jgi:hypothetical protein
VFVDALKDPLLREAQGSSDDVQKPAGALMPALQNGKEVESTDGKRRTHRDVDSRLFAP